MKILMVLTSHDKLGNTGRKTGFWLEELAAPYYVFKDAGAEVVLASPKGGQPPLDPKSNEPGFQTDLTRRFARCKGPRGRRCSCLLQGGHGRPSIPRERSRASRRT